MRSAISALRKTTTAFRDCSPAPKDGASCFQATAGNLPVLHKPSQAEKDSPSAFIFRPRPDNTVSPEEIESAPAARLVSFTVPRPVMIAVVHGPWGVLDAPGRGPTKPSSSEDNPGRARVHTTHPFSLSQHRALPGSPVRADLRHCRGPDAGNGMGHVLRGTDSLCHTRVRRFRCMRHPGRLARGQMEPRGNDRGVLCRHRRHFHPGGICRFTARVGGISHPCRSDGGHLSPRRTRPRGSGQGTHRGSPGHQRHLRQHGSCVRGIDHGIPD